MTRAYEAETLYFESNPLPAPSMAHAEAAEARARERGCACPHPLFHHHRDRNVTVVFHTWLLCPRRLVDTRPPGTTS